MLALIILLNIYFVSFRDKPEKGIPQLSDRAWEQRAKWNIPTDDMDYPVSPLYQGQLRKIGVNIHHVSRWFNGVTCEMDSATAAKVKDLQFVTDVELTRDSTKQNALKMQRKIVLDGEKPPMTEDQFELYNLTPLHNAGYEGQGILMAVCDGAFSHANTLGCFRHKELCQGYFDFTDDKEDFFETAKGNHGTSCLSAISGMDAEQNYYGAATQAQYVLMRSEEYYTESPKEMDNLVAALEKADSLGVNIFSVSLGYFYFDNEKWSLPKSALDGKSTRASRAALIAARKGIPVCAAAGNEGNKEWGTICVPGDADSVLTVGAVTSNGIVGAFSSYGPSADGRIKPEVCAVGVGTCLINQAGDTVRSNGTSFATPLIAGLAACLWSALPNENAMQIRERIIRSADRYATPDTEHYKYGYGIPDAWKAYQNEPSGNETVNLIPNDEQPHKIIRGEQILIIRHGHIYNLAGQRIE